MNTIGTLNIWKGWRGSIGQNLTPNIKNIEAQQKFTGSYKKCSLFFSNSKLGRAIVVLQVFSKMLAN